MKRGTDRLHPSSIATPQPTLRPYMIRPQSEDSVNKNSIRSFLALLVFSQLLLVAPGAMAKDQKAPFITEAYYQIEWGHFEEFMELFKRNHYPILEELLKRGAIDSIEASFPVNHASEESRWDFRLRITMSDTDKMASEFPKVSKKLYPDQKKLAEEERHRFSLLKAHTDIVIRLDDMSDW